MNLSDKISPALNGLGEVYSIQHCVIKFVSDVRHVGDFLWVLRISPPIKLINRI